MDKLQGDFLLVSSELSANLRRAVCRVFFRVSTLKYIQYLCGRCTLSDVKNPALYGASAVIEQVYTNYTNSRGNYHEYHL